MNYKAKERLLDQYQNGSPNWWKTGDNERAYDRDTREFAEAYPELVAAEETKRAQ